MGKTWQDIVKECKTSGKKFSDPDFPPKASSLYTNVDDPPTDWPNNIEWKRVSEYCSNPQLFIGGTEPGDVIQGVLGGRLCYKEPNFRLLVYWGFECYFNQTRSH